MIQYSYCPKCGQKATFKKGVLSCKKHTTYLHSAATASVFIIEGNKVLLAVRAYNPKKGTFDSVGGFVEYGEHPADAAHREVFEETGLEIKITNSLEVQMDKYFFEGINIPTLNFSYVAKIVSGTLKPSDDVAELVWCDLNKIPYSKIGFNTIKKNLREIENLYLKN